MNETEKLVEIYVLFLKLNSINTVQGTFQGEVDVVSSWFDYIDGNYDSTRHWNPQFVFENLMDSDKKIPTRIEMTRAEDDPAGRVRIIQFQKLSGTFSERLHVKEFPFDVQRIGVRITSLHPSSHIRFSGKQEYCYLAKKGVRENDVWDYNQIVSIEQNSYQEHTPYLRSQHYPIIQFRALISRKSQFYITNLVLPLFFVTSTIFVSFSHDAQAISSRLSACATTLLTSINLRFVIHNHLPNVPYSTYLDIYSMCSIVFITIVFCWHALSFKQLTQEKYIALDNYVLITFASIFLVMHVILIIFTWIRPKRRQKIFLNTVPIVNDQPIELEDLLGYERSADKFIIN